MREFFKGWRRRVGVVTLVMALAAAGMWMRSYVVTDGVLIPDGHIQYDAISVIGGMRVERLIPVPVANRLVERFWFSAPITKGRRADYSSECDIDWRRKCCGFDFGACTYPDGMRLEFAIVPYWPIAISLTIISGYLILWKPRKRSSPN